jgi:hypothetical protein
MSSLHCGSDSALQSQWAALLGSCSRAILERRTQLSHRPERAGKDPEKVFRRLVSFMILALGIALVFYPNS